jgi:arginase
MSATIIIIQAPSILGLATKGVDKLPDALLSEGLSDRIGACVGGRVEPPTYHPLRDETTLILNAQGIADYAVALAYHLAPILDRGDFPLVLGGDCSILLGNLLALRKVGRCGLLFVDGHADFYQPSAEPKGEVASMELAFATGRGPDIVADIKGLGPLVRDDDVVVFGRRDAAEAEEYGSQRIEDTQIEIFDLDQIKIAGVDSCIATALARLLRTELDGFWLHLDADVLDDAVMPAVDYRMPGGLTLHELQTVITTALKSGRVLGMDVTIFNPQLDKDGNVARSFTDMLVASLSAFSRLSASRSCLSSGG